MSGEAGCRARRHVRPFGGAVRADRLQTAARLAEQRYVAARRNGVNIGSVHHFPPCLGPSASVHPSGVVVAAEVRTWTAPMSMLTA